MDKLLTIILQITLLLANNEEEPTQLREMAENAREDKQAIHECVAELTPVYVERESPIMVKDVCEISTENDIDPALVTSISIVESGLSGNALGCKYNISGIRRNCSTYDSYRDGVSDLVDLLVHYRESGRETVEEISKSYCPPTHEEWARQVNYLIDKRNNN